MSDETQFRSMTTPPTLPAKIRIGISACLVGRLVRYNGELKTSPLIIDSMATDFELIPFCPEVEFGLPVPRDPMHLQGNPRQPRLIVTCCGKDITDRFRNWAQQQVARLQQQNLCGFIFKARSPSCGMRSVPVLIDGHRWVQQGVGLFADAVFTGLPFLPTEDDERLQDPALQRSFRQQVVAYHRWRKLIHSPTP